ncbi:hypothetical protein [Streptomyces sp. NPDC047939]|uniref:hypothetical protein n=1 Tax=Streptomyces sp. NPDC047939 TaxID=3155381 RepID=UPI00343ED15D
MSGRTSPKAVAAKQARVAARQARADHNAQFNNATTDPNGEAYLASHDRVIAAENAAKTAR